MMDKRFDAILMSHDPNCGFPDPSIYNVTYAEAYEQMIKHRCDICKDIAERIPDADIPCDDKWLIAEHKEK